VKPPVPKARKTFSNSEPGEGVLGAIRVMHYAALISWNSMPSVLCTRVLRHARLEAILNHYVEKQ
jgi:hypothetical protein